MVLPLARRYLIERSSPALALYLASRWRARAPDDPLAAYLEGLQLVRLGEYADAADALAGPPALLSEEVLDEQRRALLVISLMRLGRLDAADSILDGLLLSDNASKRLWAEEYRARVSFLRDFGGFEPWVPRGPPR